MTLDLSEPGLAERAARQPWQKAASYWAEIELATANLDTPTVILSAEALLHNARDMARRASGTTIRVASKSLRVRGAIEQVLTLPGYAGVLAFTLPEALWLAETVEDVVVGYPTANRNALRRLATDERLAGRVTIMVDAVEQLELVNSVLPASQRNTIRVCLDFDASWQAPVLGHLGVRRSPLHTPAALQDLARRVIAEPGFELVGVLSYEAQIAGVGSRPVGKPVEGAINRWMQRNSFAELSERRAEAIALVRAEQALEFVNGGGTGSLEVTSADPSITEIAAGSGLFGPHLFDNYDNFTPAPAVAFGLNIVRKPLPDTVTLLGGGWIASGPAGDDRLPQVAWPKGLSYLAREGAGEVQTPLAGDAARSLAVGDRVWLRHTKAGEIAEHANDIHILSNGELRGSIPSYRGEGYAFL
ncbi:amino acid deaminase/aldolase [Lysinibacter cavernae]|uniref:D-serine deaminase-like pyridoxal phosphate-dependent protein n=1 Tax=Lysinibacter cavernae TaxID=1640652 RepID=A0A7X5R191_9MICO|nr:amino acid deaminase/aldolase [Lysinibacter cavernae]NIH53510.1 D-serine deaminase-like pyridoxal phosphate-dependent protein [Lysinibacter cavernae]